MPFRSRSLSRLAFCACLIASPLALSACGTVDKIRGTSEETVVADDGSLRINEKDPQARPVKVAWTSARASYCGFIFQPASLRANYLAAERQLGYSPEQMKKIEEAYDYAVESVTEKIEDDPHYCSKTRTEAIREDLQAYLAGNFAHKPSQAQ